jgi:hypothetical protein
MPVFNPFPTAPTIAPAQQAANQVFALGKQVAQSVLNTYLAAYNLVWKNPISTPVEVIAAMGTSAGAVFAHSAALAAFLTAQGASGFSATVPAGWTVRTNDDGTVTATEA